MKIQYTERAVDDLMQEVETLTGIDRGLIWSRKRTDAVSRIRNLIWFVIRHHFETVAGKTVPYEAIGDYFRRDHGTVMHGVRLTLDRLAYEGDLRKAYLALCDDFDVTPVELPAFQGCEPKKIKLNVKLTPKIVPRSTWKPDPRPVTIPGRWRRRAIPAGVTADPEPYTVPGFFNYATRL